MNKLIKAQLFTTLGIESAEAIAEKELTNVTEADLPEENVEAETTAADNIETVQDEAEIDGIEDQAESLDDATENLEELDTALESYSNGKKSLTPIEAAALRLTVSQTVSRFVKDTGDLIPAAENFRGGNTDQTVLATESLKETAKTFADAAVNAARKAWERLKEIIESVINRFRGYEARANKIIVAAKKVTAEITGEVDLKKDSISVNGEASFDALRGGMERLTKSLQDLKEARSIKSIHEITNKLNEGTDPAKFIEWLTATNAAMAELFKAMFGETKDVDGWAVAAPFPGEYTPKRYIVPEGTYELSSFAIEQVKPEEKGGDVKVAAVSATEIINLAGAVKALQESVKDYKGFLRRMLAAIQDISRVNLKEEKGQPNFKDIKEEVGENGKEELKKYKKQASSFMSKQMGYYAKLVTTANNVSGNILTLCEKSLKLANAPAAAGKEEPKADETKSDDKGEAA